MILTLSRGKITTCTMSELLYRIEDFWRILLNARTKNNTSDFAFIGKYNEGIIIDLWWWNYKLELSNKVILSQTQRWNTTVPGDVLIISIPSFMFKIWNNVGLNVPTYLFYFEFSLVLFFGDDIQGITVVVRSTLLE